MNPDDILDQIDHLEELTLEARDAAKRIINAPATAKEEAENFGGLSGPALDTLHSFAYEFYKNGKYEQAASFYQVLATLDMINFDYWMGLGASQMMAREYQEALAAFSIAASLDAEQPAPHFHAAECYQAMGDTTEALRVLEVAEDFCSEEKKHLPIKERIALFKETWPKGGF